MPETSSENHVEYSSREVKPAALLLQDLLRAHATFLLHHDSSLSALFVRTNRTKLTKLLGRYWDLFLSTWNVLLHGNPICNVFDGIKIAASGELGVGVGEEERGSGEREVLEGLVGRIEGLVDLVVSKYGPYESDTATGIEAEQWLGTGNEPAAEDGAIFLGVGALSKHSLRNVVHWMDDLYTWGVNAYGVIDSPTSTRQTRRDKKSKMTSPQKSPTPQGESPGETTQSISPKQGQTDLQSSENTAVDSSVSSSSGLEEADVGGIDKYMDYLKLGYGKYWSLGSGGGNDIAKLTPAVGELSKKHANDIGGPIGPQEPRVDNPAGHFLIGLMGEVEEDEYEDLEESRFHDSLNDAEYNSRTMLRTVTVELEGIGLDRSDSQKVLVFGSQETEIAEQGTRDRGDVPESITATFQSQDSNKTHKLRVVVYVNKPFIFTFLFKLRTDSLAWDGLYRSLHNQLSPLRKPLGNSSTYRPERPDQGATVAQIYDLVWDAKSLTLHSTIPNIPEPGTIQNGEPTAWSRVEALNTHMQILNVYITAKSDASELERTCKTSRGWWIVWNRILEKEQSTSPDEFSGRNSPGSESEEGGSNEEDTISPMHENNIISKEIFLIRKASDHGGSHVRAVSMGGGWADGASRLAQGIGVDTRKYIEGLLSLSR